ncbi:MFS transporter [Candidatus Bathyarchaeota archaeon]|nr:MAG: MFS transporter [Candidatus Bathyarchaeota archaeon]
MSGRDYSATYFLLCGIALLAMFSTSLILPLIPIYAKQIGATGVVIGFSVAAYWISRIVMEIPSGFVSQRFGYYRSMAVGLGLNVVGTALSAYAVNPIQFVLARALMGIGAPLFFAVATTFVLNLFDAERRGGAMGIFQGIEFAGTIVGSTFSGYVVSVFDFRLSFLFSAGLILIALILVVVPPHIRSESVRMTASSSLSLSAMREVFWNRRLLIVSSATFAEFIMSTGILMTVFPLYASEGLGFSLTSIGLLMGSRSVGFVVAMFSMGAISDRVGRKPVLLFGVGATAVLIAVLNFVSSFVGLVAAFFLLGITTGAIWIVCPVLAAEAVEPHQRGAAIGTYRTFFDLGSILGPIVMSAVMEGYGIAPCFYLASALLFANLVPVLRLDEKR